MNQPTKTPTGITPAGDPVERAAAAVGHLYEAKERLKDAVGATGEAVRSAAVTASQAVRADLSAGKESITDPLHDVASAGRNAASDAKAAVVAEADQLMEKSRELWGSAEGVIRQHPLAAFGAAFAVGWLVSRLGRRN